MYKRQALNTEGRLRPIEPRDPGVLGAFLSRTRFFDPRYRRSAEARLGINGRHVGLALGLAAVAGIVLWRRAGQRQDGDSA